jgi:hypothetical protein
MGGKKTRQVVSSSIEKQYRKKGGELPCRSVGRDTEKGKEKEKGKGEGEPRSMVYQSGRGLDARVVRDMTEAQYLNVLVIN